MTRKLFRWIFRRWRVVMIPREPINVTRGGALPARLLALHMHTAQKRSALR